MIVENQVGKVKMNACNENEKQGDEMNNTEEDKGICIDHIRVEENDLNSIDDSLNEGDRVAEGDSDGVDEGDRVDESDRIDEDDSDEVNEDDESAHDRVETTVWRVTDTSNSQTEEEDDDVDENSEGTTLHFFDSIVLGDEKTDPSVALTCLEASFHMLKQHFPHIKKVILQSDNACEEFWWKCHNAVATSSSWCCWPRMHCYYHN